MWELTLLFDSGRVSVPNSASWHPRRCFAVLFSSERGCQDGQGVQPSTIRAKVDSEDLFRIDRPDFEVLVVKCHSE